MKKLSLVLALVFALVAVFAGTALAEQAKIIDAAGNTHYNSTTAGTTYESGNLPRLKAVNQFNNDGVTNYPYEIYLPNEGNPASYRIHSNYTNDTDACASCHATHTAVGAGLLQWYSVYDTCIACHDGTVTTTYNVVAGKVGATDFLTYGGMFGTGNEQFLSNHNVTGALSISAAPGGSTVGVERTTDMGKVITQWQTTFGCESCHSPHGQGGNARILHPDANGVATQKKATSYTTVEYPAESGEYAVLVNGKPALFLVGYPYKVTVTGGEFIDNSAGYSKFSAAGLTVEGTPSLKVTMAISGYLTTGESVTHVSGMNAFCGACHTDYNTEDVNRPGVNANGTFSKAMRHAVGVDYKQMFVENPVGIGSTADKYMKTEGNNITCLTCHLAHGVAKDYWVRAMDKTEFNVFGNWGTDNAKLAELAGSSALKRLPNMATCEACHEKGAAALGYVANTTGGAETTPLTATSGTEDAPKPAVYAGLNWNTINQDWVGSAACEPCHADYVAGWKNSGHKTPYSSYTATPSRTSCSVCHLSGAQVMRNLAGSSFFRGATDALTGVDAATTCETCHGSGKNHIKNPSSKNISMPKDFDAQVKLCATCHDMDGGRRAMKTIGSAQSTDIWFAAANHGGAYMYSTSGHYKTKTASCTTCHDVHKRGTVDPTLKLSYTQLCISCHDTIGPVASTMGFSIYHTPKGATDYAGNFNHSFKFGMNNKTASGVTANVYYAASFSSSHGGFDSLVSTAGGTTPKNIASKGTEGDTIFVRVNDVFRLHKNVDIETTPGVGPADGLADYVQEASGTNVIKADGVWAVTRIDGTVDPNVTLEMSAGIPTKIIIGAAAAKGGYVLTFKPTGNAIPLSVNAFTVID